MLDSTTTDLKAVLVKRKNRIVLANLLHSIEGYSVGDISVWIQPINVEKLIISLVPGGSCRKKDIATVRCVIAGRSILVSVHVRLQV